MWVGVRNMFVPSRSLRAIDVQDTQTPKIIVMRETKVNLKVGDKGQATHNVFYD